MCGIIGCIGRGGDTLDTLVHGLEKLEYRGYDSAGVALLGEELAVSKTAGKVADLRAVLDEQDLSGRLGIGHTRWSTHGPPTDENAHPHLDCSGEDGLDPEAAFRSAIAQLEGSYAIVALLAGSDVLFAARNDSPLVVGLGDGSEFFIASDVPAFRDFTGDVVYLDDGEFARLDRELTVSAVGGERVSKSTHTVEWDAEETGKSGYDHFMLKEIHEQPRALRQCLRGRVQEQTASVDIGDLAALSPTGVQFVACGTSYHAALYGAQLFRDAGIPAQAFLASEYATAVPPVGSDLVVGISQSGETADTLSALREAQQRGAETLTLTNTVGSTMSRECDHALYIRSGPEIGVAATKTFAGQLAALNLLSLATVERSRSRRDALPSLRNLPGDVQQILDSSNADTIAEVYEDAQSYFFIGRGYQYPVALEGALKLKEISYEHAEGFAAGELKHGPLALVDSETPVFALVVGDGEKARKTVGNIKEVEARDAPVVAVTDGQSDAARYADHVLEIPETTPRAAAVLGNVQLQLVAYHVANRLGRSIDKPRNLAKSVTVE